MPVNAVSVRAVQKKPHQFYLLKAHLKMHRCYKMLRLCSQQTFLFKKRKKEKGLSGAAFFADIKASN